jgi:DNA-binding NtrC family response regulator
MKHAETPILVIDATRSMDQAAFRTLAAKGYKIRIAETANKALELIHQTRFKCIVIDIATSASSDYGGLAEIRQFIRASAVALIMQVPLQSLIREALDDGSIELLPIPVLSGKIQQLSRPALLVGTRLQPEIIQSIRRNKLLFSYGTTLQIAMNLLVDGWCDIILIAANVGGLVGTDEIAVFHQVRAKQLAILASTMPRRPSGIICVERPQEADDYIALFEQIAGNRISARGSKQEST